MSIREISCRNVEDQLSRRYRDNLRRQSGAVNYEGNDNVVEDKVYNLTENNSSLTNKIKSSVIDYFCTHPITVASNAGGAIGAVIGGTSGLILGSLALVSAPVSIPIGMGIGAVAAMLITQKLTYEVGMSILAENGAFGYLPLPNSDYVQEEIQLLENKINNLNFQDLKNLLLEKIGYLDQVDLRLETLIYHNSTFPLVIEHLLSREEIKNGLIDAMSNQEIEVLLTPLIHKTYGFDFSTQPSLKSKERLIECFKVLLKEDRILDVIENIYLKQPTTRLQIIEAVKCANDQALFDLFVRLHKSLPGAHEINRNSQVLVLDRLLNVLTRAKEVEGSDDFDLFLIQKMKKFIDEILQEGTNDNADFLQQFIRIRQSLETLHSSRGEKKAYKD